MVCSMVFLQFPWIFLLQFIQNPWDRLPAIQRGEGEAVDEETEGHRLETVLDPMAWSVQPRIFGGFLWGENPL